MGFDKKLECKKIFSLEVTGERDHGKTSLGDIWLLSISNSFKRNSFDKESVGLATTQNDTRKG